MMKNKIYRLIVLLQLCLILSACEIRVLDNNQVEEIRLPSLEDIYPSLEAKAFEINPETNLQTIIISLLPEKDKSEHVILAEFDNVLDDDVIYIYYYADGTIEGKLESMDGLFDFPEIRNEPLVGFEYNETILSAEDALSIMIDYADVSIADITCLGCSKLILDRYKTTEFDQVIWMLVLRECEGEVIKQIEIDAHTGELYYME